MKIFVGKWVVVKLFCLRITSQRLLGSTENNIELSQDNTVCDMEPTLDYWKFFLSVFRSSIRKKFTSKAIAAKRATMFDIAYKLVLASVASEECLRNTGLGNR
jgi:hypothetical protein